MHSAVTLGYCNIVHNRWNHQYRTKCKMWGTVHGDVIVVPPVEVLVLPDSKKGHAVTNETISAKRYGIYSHSSGTRRNITKSTFLIQRVIGE